MRPMFDADQCAEQRYGMNKRLRPIDGIENPTVATRTRLLAGFFTQHAVAGKPVVNRLTDQLFRPTVGVGYGSGISFPIDIETGGMIVAQNQFARFRTHVAGKLQPVGNFGSIVGC